MPEGSEDYEPVETAVDLVTCELMLETARACRTLIAAAEETEALIRRREASPARTEILVTRHVRRIELLFRLVPSILDPRRIVCLCDMAADRPDWWRANKLHFFEPGLTYRQIAAVLDLNAHQVRDAVNAVEIPADCYENLPEIK